MAAPRKYPDELRERATRMAVEARRDPATRPGALARVAGQLGINPETLRNWVTQAEIDGGVRPGTTTDDAQRLLELGEVSLPGLEVPALDVHLGPVAEHECPEPVPLRLVAPSLAERNLLLRLGEHGLDGRLDRKGHRPIVAVTCCILPPPWPSPSDSWALPAA